MLTAYCTLFRRVYKEICKKIKKNQGYFSPRTHYFFSLEQSGDGSMWLPLPSLACLAHGKFLLFLVKGTLSRDECFCKRSEKLHQYFNMCPNRSNFFGIINT